VQADTQAEPRHTWPEAQLVPQLPQFAGFSARSTHPPAHTERGLKQVVLHAPVEQTLPCGQVVPHSPQLLGSNCVLVHTPPQIAWPTGHPLASKAVIAFPLPPQPTIARKSDTQIGALPRLHQFIKTVMRFAPMSFNEWTQNRSSEIPTWLVYCNFIMPTPEF
jgi:hypothetical protein